MLKAAESKPPTYEDIAQYNIILYSSIILVLCAIFGHMAMVNMVRAARRTCCTDASPLRSHALSP